MAFQRAPATDGEEYVFPVKFDNARMQDYQAVMEERPRKFDQKAANYHRAGQKEPRCDQCMHFFARHIDRRDTVCEVVRPVPEEAIDPSWTCKFQTPDGRRFPLYK